MNTTTHLLAAIVGGLLAASGLSPSALRGDFIAIGAVFAVCHMLPDIEVLLRKKGTISQLTQRGGMTHSLLLALVVPWAVAAAALGGGVPVFVRAGLAGMAGYGSHILLDLLSTYPVAALWPVRRRFSLGILHGGDPGMLLGIVLPGFFFASPPLALSVLGLFFVLYIGIRVGYMIHARRRWPFFKAHLGREKVELVTFLPDSFQPWVWKVAIKTDDAFHAWNLDLLTGVAGERQRFDRRESGLVRRARALPLVREIDAFTPFFALTEHPPAPGETRVKITGKDVRYHFYGKGNPLRLDLIYEGNNLVDSKMY